LDSVFEEFGEGINQLVWCRVCSVFRLLQFQAFRALHLFD